MTHLKRISLTALLCLAAPLTHAAYPTVQVAEEDLPYFQALEDALPPLMDAASACREANADLYTCLCEESSALEGMEAALESALQNKPDWEDKGLHYEGVNLLVPGLQKQIDMVREQCPA